MPGSIGQYQLSEKIAESDTIQVWRGIRSSDRRAVILKILKPSAAERDTVRLKHEFTILSRLNLPGVIKVLALEKSEQGLFMVLEDIGGESIDRLLAGGKRLPLERFLNLITKLVESLASIHDQGIVHKDLNPAHIIVNTESDDFRLIGFGAADEQSPQSGSPQTPAALEGTVEYMSPEQTGRMNRVVDYRTDFYSLGVTFYRLLTGQLPFTAPDSLGIIHLHIAGAPTPPQEINPAIPKTLSRIVLKLMAKMADDRYQNAWGLKADLDRCLHELRTQWVISDFEPGSQDFSDRLQMPQKLYGREQDINRMLTAFEQTCTGEKELFLIAGYAGVGKTRLVRELHRTVLKKQGYFIESKFEQLQRAEPYWGWVQSIKILINYLLMENEIHVEQWKRNILKAVGSIGKVLTDVIPDLELIIGPQPGIPELGGAEAQNRFNFVFVEFIKAIADKEHPLIVFLDDLQWIDAASLRLLRLILTDSSVTHVLLIGAYRDNEVDALHPLAAGIDTLRKEKASLEQQTVLELTEETTNEFVADILHSIPAQTAALTRLMYSKTGGNPFFIIQTFMTLVEKKVILFDKKNRIWRWETFIIEKMEITDNIVALMIEKIRKLPADTRHLLQLAACIGFKFNAFHLSVIAKLSEEEILEGLRPALRAGLISANAGQYQFVHDRIQQAAYSIIPYTDRKKVHLEIGRLLLGHMPYRDHEEQLFTVVDHLNIGAELIDSADERFKLARLNLRAGRKAKASGALLISNGYFEAGLSLLDKKSWEAHYRLTLELHSFTAETASLSGFFERVDQLYSVVIQNAASVVDTVGVYESKMHSFGSQGLLNEVVDTALEILGKLGLNLTPSPTTEDIHRAMEETKSLFAAINIENLVNFPQMTDCDELAKMRVMAKVIIIAYSNRPALCQMIVITAVYICITYGNSIYSPLFYAAYAFVCTSHGEIDSGYRFGKLSMALLESTNNTLLRAKTLQTVNSAVWHFVQHLRTTLPGLEDGYQSALETGDLEYAGHNALAYCRYSYFAGVELLQLEKLMALYDIRLQGIRGEIPRRDMATFWQATLNLLGLSENRCRLIGKRFDERTMLPALEKTQNHTAIASMYLNRLMLCYLFGEYQMALESSELFAKNKDAMLGMFSLSVFNFYDSLTRLQIYSHSDAKTQSQIIEKVSDNQRELKLLADHAPMNQLHRFYLVEAERIRVTGQDMVTALDYYDRAISIAGQNEYIQEKALANELAARYWLEKGKEDFCRIYLLRAHHDYSSWGATRKVRDLEERYASLLAVKLEEPRAETPLERLDLSTVMKATQAVSGEIEMNRLLNLVMHIVIENAGAQHGCLLMEQDDLWKVIAEGEINHKEVEIPTPLSIDESDSVSSAVVHFVARTKSKIVLDNAVLQGEFINDPHIKKKNTRSLLCAPLLHRGKLISILYLENNLTTHAFTNERVQFLETLLSQVAISLENASTHKALHESETKYRLIVETASEGVIAIRSDSRVSFANSRMAKILGYSQDEMLGKRLLDLVPEEEWPDLEQKMRNRRSGISESYEYRLLRKDSQIVWVLISAVPLLDEKKCFYGAFAILTDITGRKHAENELQESKNRLKILNENLETIVSKRTQEVRELSKALSVAEQRERRRMSQMLYEDLLQILLSANIHIAMLSSDIKENPDLLLEIGEVKQMVQKAINSAKTLAVEFNPPVLKHEGLDVALKWLIRHVQKQYGLEVTDVSLDPCREMDPDIRLLLVQFVRELFVNIVRHAKTDKAELSVRCKREVLKLIVRDRGSGFDVDKARETTKVQESVGLFSIEERLKLIGGKMKIVSVPGKGTIVRIVVPIEVSFLKSSTY